MKIKPFALERYFAKYEFSAPYLLSPSDCDPLTLKELLSMADEESLKLWNNLWLGYTESQGHLLLREEIAKLYKNISPEDILVIVPEEGVFIAMNVLLNKGDHVVSTFPGYQSLYEIADSLGAEVSKWKPRKNVNEWDFNLEDLKDLVKGTTKLIVFNFPHNPTGATLNKKKYKELSNFAKSKNIYVFSDEMYRFLEYSKEDRLDSASDLYENAISLFGMSKTFALAGLRIGWLTTKNKDLYKRLAAFKDYTTICNSAPSEILSIIALRNKNKIIERNMKIIKNNLNLLDKLFKKHSNLFDWVKPKAGTIAFPELKVDKPIDDFAKESVDKKGVMILPSSVYDYEGNNFRVGFGRKNFKDVLDKFEDFIKKYT